MTNLPPHLALEHLVPLAAQVAAAIHLGADDLASQDHGIRREVKQKAYNLKHRDGDLPKLFRVLSQDIDHTARGVRLSVGFSQAIRELKKDLSERSCRKCRQGGRRCGRDRPTREKVHLGGNCISPIKAIFEEIRAEIGALWRRAIPGAPMPVLQLGTRQLAFQDRLALFGDFAVTGKATIVNADKPTTTILLAVYNRPFDWDDFVLLPYLLFHEIVCHGFQDVYDPSGGAVARRFAADPECLWSEGWMDTASHYLASSWLEARREATKDKRHSISNEHRVRLASKRTDDFHNARYGLDREILSKERHQGRNAFEHVKEGLITGGMARADALDLLSRFSIALNGTDISGFRPGAKPNDVRTAIACSLDAVAVSDNPSHARTVMERFVRTLSLAELDADLPQVSV